jgi:hyaluronoglucosaminidase
MTSPFAIRGVIEGFYGNPWTHDERLDCLRFMGAHGMNTFVYGPKDDPLVRRRWRDAYDGEALARLREVVAVAAEAGVDVVYAISPGLSIRYADPSDTDALVAKLESLATLGISRFGLFLDDLPPRLLHASDAARFADITDAHATLAASLATRLGPSRPLLVCPLVYHGRGDEPSLARLASALDPRVDLLWTGREICSRVLEVDDAERFAGTTGRQPLYWDNYPVNDVAMGWELHIGPYLGRDRLLHRAARGVLANPMELWEASKIPLATVAAYLADPEGYDPEAAFAAAVREVAGDGSPDGGADAAAFALFADNVRSSCLNDDDAPAVGALLASFEFEVGAALETRDDDRRRRAAATLRGAAEQHLAAAGHLLRGAVANPSLVDECRPWIEAFEVGARAMCHAAVLAADGRLGDLATTRAELLPYLADLRARRVRIFGDALDMFLADITVTYTRPGRSLGTQGGGLS